jgi:hypothetical protein
MKLFKVWLVAVDEMTQVSNGRWKVHTTMVKRTRNTDDVAIFLSKRSAKHFIQKCFSNYDKQLRESENVKFKSGKYTYDIGRSDNPRYSWLFEDTDTGETKSLQLSLIRDYVDI